MGIEIALAGILFTTICKLITYTNTCDKKKIEIEWDKLMQYTEYVNRLGSRFTIEKVTENTEGYICEISIPIGLNYNQLLSMRCMLQSDLNCFIKFEPYGKSNAKMFLRYSPSSVPIKEVR